MANLDLRPLSLGEILDRSFALYRQHFPLFVGIAAIPQLLLLALFAVMGIASVPFLIASRGQVPSGGPGMIAGIVVVVFIGIVVVVLAGLLAQGATVFAVADLYLGRPTTIRESLVKARGELGTLFGVSVLSGLIFLAGLILFIIPGIYLIFRLFVAVPAALVENISASDSVSRSFALTKGNAGRAFVIMLLYGAILYASMLLVYMPLTILTVIVSRYNPAIGAISAMAAQLANAVASVVVTPILMISISVFYFDLRVRKEAFDLQMMLNPAAAPAAGGTAGVLS